jgi:hypothetical protein
MPIYCIYNPWVNSLFSCFQPQGMGSQSTHIEYHSVCPLVGIGTPHPHSRAGECASPWNQWGECQFRRLKRKPSTLSTMWTVLREIPRMLTNSGARLQLGEIIQIYAGMGSSFPNKTFIIYFMQLQSIKCSYILHVCKA